MFFICLKGLTCLRSNSVLSVKWKERRVTCPCGGTPHNQGYTTLLPNIGIYEIIASANKCTSVVKGRLKNNVKIWQNEFVRFEMGKK